MIYDCFTFLNELDLLEFRMEYLSEHVDYFVIVESNLTFSGRKKPYYIEQSGDRFAKWSDKIIYLTIEQTIDHAQGNGQSNLQNYSWLLEYQQRNAIKEAINVNNEDLVFIGDLDEIPNAKVLKKIDRLTEPIVFSMALHYYYINCRSTGKEKYWNGTICVTGEFFNNTTPQNIRNNRNQYIQIAKSGWHFSYLGGINTIKNKIQSFAHTEYNNPEYVDDKNIENAMFSGADIFKRKGIKFKVIPIFLYPYDIRRLMIKRPNFIKRTSTINWIIKSVNEYIKIYLLY